MGTFQALKIWQRAKALAVFLYRLSKEGAFAKDYGVRDQIRRAAVSISSNIAEGDELNTDRQAIKFFHNERALCGSSYPNHYSHEIGYITKEHLDYVQKECRAISSVITRLAQARSAAVNKLKQSLYLSLSSYAVIPCLTLWTFCLHPFSWTLSLAP